MLAVSIFKETEVTGITTDTSHDALTPDSSVAVAVIVAVPKEFAVTLPFSSTDATLLLLEVQISILFAVFGNMVALNVSIIPIGRFN